MADRAIQLEREGDAEAAASAAHTTGYTVGFQRLEATELFASHARLASEFASGVEEGGAHRDGVEQAAEERPYTEAELRDEAAQQELAGLSDEELEAMYGQKMAANPAKAITCAVVATGFLCSGDYGAAQAELYLGAKIAERPKDQGKFAGMAGILERDLTHGDNPTLDPDTRDHLIADLEQFRADMMSWFNGLHSHNYPEPVAAKPPHDGERRVLGDTEMLVIRLREADERVRQMETGSTPRYSDSERSELAQLALTAMHPERLRSAVDGATVGADNFNTARVVARNIANTMATIDGPDATNPFTGTTLEKVYSSAQRWNAFITRRGEPETLQQLLNMRSTLVDYVEISSMALYEAQQNESRLFVRVKSAGPELSSETATEHHRAVQTVKDAALSFKSALDDLRQFRNHPTDQPGLRSAFQEVESLELVIAKTGQSIEAAKDSGLGVNEQDRRELREVQTMLKAFLQKHDATIPLQSEALLSTIRDTDAIRTAPQHTMR